MQSLGEILDHRDTQYLRYLSRKTQYLITQDKAEFIHKFWQHLIIEHHPRRVLPGLSVADKKSFFLLLKHFGHDARSEMKKKYQLLEKKIPWVLMHPEGGYFVPYEIIKTLMPRSALIPLGYLFQLLYAMPQAEQNALRALLARSHRSRETLGPEKHPLDRALSLYIWTAGHRYQPTMGRKIKHAASANIWQHLILEFPNLEDAIGEWQHVMQAGRKGFYRSLLLIRGAELLKRYVASLAVVPVTSRRHRIYPAHNLKFTVPLEFLPDKTALKSR